MNEKFCINCKHCRIYTKLRDDVNLEYIESTATCTREYRKETSEVSGREYEVGRYLECWKERRKWHGWKWFAPDICGPEGKYFEEKVDKSETV